MRKVALISGVTGQDGAYLAKYLLDLDYIVFGGLRRTSSTNLWRLDHLEVRDHKRFELVDLDVTDPGNCLSVMKSVQPCEVYNLAAQSFVGVSFEQPMSTCDITGKGCLNMLEAVRIVCPETRFYQASTSELFGLVQQTPQNEQTPFYPRSPYAVAKLYAHWMTINYRESYNLFASTGILFNHESPLRGEEFVTRKITKTVAQIKSGVGTTLKLGNLDAKRDWGFAKEYVEGMHLILQTDQPDNFVLATGKTSTVREFVRYAFEALDMQVEFHGTGDSEIGIDPATGKNLVVVSREFYRPAEVELLIGDPTKAKDTLGWKSKTSVGKLAEIMAKFDYMNIT